MSAANAQVVLAGGFADGGVFVQAPMPSAFVRAMNISGGINCFAPVDVVDSIGLVWWYFWKQHFQVTTVSEPYWVKKTGLLTHKLEIHIWAQASEHQKPNVQDWWITD